MNDIDDIDDISAILVATLGVTAVTFAVTAVTFGVTTVKMTVTTVTLKIVIVFQVAGWSGRSDTAFLACVPVYSYSLTLACGQISPISCISSL